MSLYDHVAVVHPGLSLERRRALVEAARSRRISTSVDEELRETQADLNELDESVPSLRTARQRVADTDADLEALRERVASLRGRLQATGDESDETAYRSAVRDLAEAETEHVAAREALEVARREARSARRVRDRRMRLEDRVENLRRRARSELVDATRPMVEAILAETPGCESTDYADTDAVSAALAVVRYGHLERPIVLACRRFDDATEAAEWLDVPVIRL